VRFPKNVDFVINPYEFSNVRGYFLWYPLKMKNW
jgi:hypothetical protein